MCNTFNAFQLGYINGFISNLMHLIDSAHVTRQIVYVFLQIFTGNVDNTGIVYNWLSVPTKARFVRFRASDVSGTHICVRLEFYGSIDSKGMKDN